MKRLVIALAFVLAACTSTPTPPKIAASLLVTYDAAVATEVAALSAGKVTPTEATNLRACRVAANNAIQSVVAAETNGSASSSIASQAQIAVSAYSQAATNLTSCSNV